MIRKKVCKNCRFWDRSTRARGECHRHAPIAKAGSEWMGLASIYNALYLLTWWYIREHSDDALAEQQLHGHLGGEGLNEWEADFPTTEPTQWCGDWKGKPIDP
jgi:hypothetical protein